jgi:hypothetical protein
MDHPPSATATVYGTGWKADYQALVGETVACLRRGQSDLLEHYWTLGELYTRFLTGVENRAFGDLDAKSFVQSLQEQGLEIGVANLQQAKRIHDHYQREALPGLVARGLTVSHLKALLPMDEALRGQVEERIRREDGSVCSTRAMQEVIRATRVEAIADKVRSAAAGLGEEETIAEADSAPADEADQAVHDELDRDPAGERPAAREAAGAARTAVARPGAGGRGAGAPTASGRPPLPIIKAINSAAEKFADQLPELWRALTAVQKTGWDSDRQRDNFRVQAELLCSVMEGMQSIAPQAIAKLRAALDDGQG